MTIPRVSILLPTYNRAHILPEAIEGVILQSFTDWELIILDDCSHDNTWQISQEYIQKNPQIRYHRNVKNIKQPANRNVGISLAKADLVFFIEDDLILERDCVSVLIATFNQLKNNTPVGGIMPRLLSELEEELQNKSCEPIIFNRFTGEMCLNYWIQCEGPKEVITTHACTLYQKSAIVEAGGYPENIYAGNCYREESDLNFRLLRHGYHFFYQPMAVANHKVQKKGGCRDFSFLMFELYKIRNHIVFLIRIFKFKAFYMIPFYLIERVIKSVSNILDFH